MSCRTSERPASAIRDPKTTELSLTKAGATACSTTLPCGYGSRPAPGRHFVTPRPSPSRSRPCPGIVRTRADQAAGATLLQRMRGPAGGAGHRKDRRERLPRDVQRIKQDRGEELDIGLPRPVRVLLAQ